MKNLKLFLFLSLLAFSPFWGPAFGGPASGDAAFGDAAFGDAAFGDAAFGDAVKDGYQAYYEISTGHFSRPPVKKPGELELTHREMKFRYNKADYRLPYEEGASEKPRIPASWEGSYFQSYRDYVTGDY